MRIVFRADASLATGSGHVMRSSAIAEEVIARGIPAIFVGKISDLPWVKNRISNLGFHAVIEDSDLFVSNPSTDILILDSYEIPLGTNFIQPDNWRAVVNIFDELTPLFKSRLRIHPGLTKLWPVSMETKTLSGPEYIPLRKSIKKSEFRIENDCPKIIVVGGGSDINGFVSAVSKSLFRCKEIFQASIFASEDLNFALDERFSVVPIGDTLDEFASRSDLVFTTASTTSLEFIARGCAVAVGCAVDNQSLYYKELNRGGFAAPIGEFLNSTWSLDEVMIRNLVNSDLLRARLRNTSTGLIDMRGATRIVDEILRL